MHPFSNLILMVRGNCLIQGLNKCPKSKVPVVGTASLNLAEFASVADQKEFELNLPLSASSGSVDRPALCVRAFSLFFLSNKSQFSV